MTLSSLTKITLLIVIFHYIQASNIDTKEIIEGKKDPNYRKTWMYIADEKGVPFNISLKYPITESEMIQIKISRSSYDKASFWLYTKENKQNPIELKTSGKDSITNFQFTSKFNSKKPIKFIIHGWRDKYQNFLTLFKKFIFSFISYPRNRDSFAVKEVRRAYLEKAGKDYNIIAVDWEDAASDILYYPAAYATKTIGQFVAHVINHMRANHGVNVKDVHIIGHSLGAHAAGVAGSVFQSLSGQKVGRITGTDPAYPLFEDTSNRNAMLDSSDAEFVDVIHTCAGLMGHNKNLGHADFYPNGGEQPQPGCDNLSESFIGSCSHEKAVVYFADSIPNPNKYMAQQCSSWKSFKRDECSSGKIPMGDTVPRNARGQYYLRTEGSNDDSDSDSDYGYGYYYYK